VNTQMTSGYDWIKQIPHSVLELDSVPLLGTPPSFPWAEFTEELRKLLQLEDLQIQFSPMQWRDSDKHFEGIEDTSPLFFTIPSLEGTFCWAMSKSDISTLMSIVVLKQASSFPEIDADFQEGFYHFLAIEVLNTLTKVDFDKNLKPALSSSIELPTKPSLCADISISIKQSPLFGRLILSPEFHTSWKERYAHRTLGSPYRSPLAQKLSVTMHLEAGKVNLNLSEWSKVIPGDFLLLDSCSLEQPGFDKGRIMLTINGIPFFRGKIKEGNIKILEYPLHHEVEMAPKNPQDDDEIEEFEDSDFEDDSEMEDDTEDEEEYGEFAEENEETLSDEPTQENPKPPKNALDSKKLSESPAISKPPISLETNEQKPITTEDIPLTVIVEVGRLQITVQKLMELQPGNLLELNVHPENGIDLVVNGKCIGKGELLRIGESLGVRILDIG
jgi:flagellar motor switch protein FliN